MQVSQDHKIEMNMDIVLESESESDSESDPDLIDNWEELLFVRPKNSKARLYLFDTEAERRRWEQLSFRQGTFLHNTRKEYYAELLKQQQCAVYISLYTNASWAMMTAARAKRRDQNSMYGFDRPLSISAKITTVYMIDWNIETKRILAFGSVFDPKNIISKANTNGRPVHLYTPPYEFMNRFVYGGPRWNVRANIVSPEIRSQMYILEQILYEHPFLPHIKKKSADMCLFISGGLKRLTLKHAVLFEEQTNGQYIHQLCARALERPNKMI